MTSHERDFDQLARAWLELGPNEAPDRPIAAVLQAIETTPQARRAWRWPTWRSTTMSRITILAVLAGTIALIVGGLVLSGGGPAPAPLSVVVASPTPTAGYSLRPGELGVPLPDAIKGGWSAASRGTAMEETPVTTLALGGSSMDRFAPVFSLDHPGSQQRKLGSNVVEIEPGLLRFILSTPGSSDCDLRADGRYRWSLSADGQWLTFERITEACPVRGEILEGTWQRNLGFPNQGGPGIATNVEPYLTYALPISEWSGTEFSEIDTVVNDSGDRTFKVWKDLDGFVDPCDRSKGRLLIEPGMDAFLAYLREDPRFTVTREAEYELDGHRAVEVEYRIGADITAPCWDLDGDPADKTGVLTYVPQANSFPEAFWNAPIDSLGLLVVTEVDGATLVFESAIVEPDGSAVVDREVLDTVRFHDALPEAPAS
jgi:hypothetical protein